MTIDNLKKACELKKEIDALESEIKTIEHAKELKTYLSIMTQAGHIHITYDDLKDMILSVSEAYFRKHVDDLKKELEAL